jgi:hypothetical protein
MLLWVDLQSKLITCTILSIGRLLGQMASCSLHGTAITLPSPKRRFPTRAKRTVCLRRVVNPDDFLAFSDLAKGLVCVQVLWVAGQAIERKIAGFPISLLEFHTLVHVFCAIVMYMLWFRKPYDINEPTVIPTEDFPNALAFVVASSRWAGASDSRRSLIFVRATGRTTFTVSGLGAKIQRLCSTET